MSKAPYRQKPLPLIIIGGFLGAGKTTLINHLLEQSEGRRLGVIVNDIGSVNIDDDLIQSADEDRIALTNGCICCALKTELLDAISTLVKEQTGIDSIVVEASGVANPMALVQSLQLLESANMIRTETVVYIVDASSFSKLDFDESELVLDHAALSDLIVINKQDIASKLQLDQLDQHLDECSVRVSKHRTSHSKLPVSLLFSPDDSDLAVRKNSDRKNKSGLNHYDYVECSLTSEFALNRDMFEVFVGNIADHCWRAKGLLRFSSTPEQMHLFNLVGQRASLEALKQSDNIGDRQLNRMVVIAQRQHINLDKIRCEFESCVD